LPSPNIGEECTKYAYHFVEDKFYPPDIKKRLKSFD